MGGGGGEGRRIKSYVVLSFVHCSSSSTPHVMRVHSPPSSSFLRSIKHLHESTHIIAWRRRRGRRRRRKIIAWKRRKRENWSRRSILSPSSPSRDRHPPPLADIVIHADRPTGVSHTWKGWQSYIHIIFQFGGTCALPTRSLSMKVKLCTRLGIFIRWRDIGKRTRKIAVESGNPCWPFFRHSFAP